MLNAIRRILRPAKLESIGKREPDAEATEETETTDDSTPEETSAEESTDDGTQETETAEEEAPPEEAALPTPDESTPPVEEPVEETAPPEDRTLSFAERYRAVESSPTRTLLERAARGLEELAVLLGADATEEDLLTSMLRVDPPSPADDPAAEVGRLVELADRRLEEAEGLRSVIETRESELTELRERVEKDTDELVRLRGELEEAKRERDEAREELDGVREKMETLTSEQAALADSLEQRMNELAAMKDRVGDAERETESAAAERDRLEKHLETSRDESEKLRETEASLRWHLAEWAEGLCRADPTYEPDDDDEVDAEAARIDHELVLDRGREGLDRLTFELAWRRAEMAGARESFRKSMWKMAGGPARRVRNWPDRPDFDLPGSGKRGEDR